MKTYKIKKATMLFEYLKKYNIPWEKDGSSISDTIIVHLKKNFNNDELFWFGVGYGMYCNKLI